MSINLEPQNTSFQAVSVNSEPKLPPAGGQAAIANQPIGADSFMSQDQLNALMMQEYAMQQRRQKASGFLKLLLLAGVGSIFIFSGKARAFVMKPFRKLLNKPAEITTKADFDKHVSKLLENLKKRAIQTGDINPVNLRLIDEAPADKINLLENVGKIAREYSNSPNGVPSITLKLKENSEKAQKVLRYAMENPGKITPEIADSIETVSLKFANKGARINKGNDVEFEFIGRTLEGLEEKPSWLSKLFSL